MDRRSQRRPPTGAAQAPDARLAGSYRFERNGWIFVHLEGAPRRSATSTATCWRRRSRTCSASSSRSSWRPRNGTGRSTATSAEKILWPGIDEEYRAELDGIVAGLAAKGVAADRWDIVALNALEEIPGYYVPWLDKQQGRTPVGKAPGNCSAFVATGDWTKDQRIVIGHNAWTNYITGARWNIIFDIKPAQRAPHPDGRPARASSRATTTSA